LSHPTIVAEDADVYDSHMHATRHVPLRALLCALALAIGCASGGDHSAGPAPDGRAARLQLELGDLAGGADPTEANRLAEAALAESARLAAEYRMARPALFNNLLVNVGFKRRGLCWHWTEDLLAALGALRLTSYELHWGTAHRGRLFREHNSVIVTARGQSLASGIVLDPWRDSGALHWVAVSEDHYPWEPR
jgi:hypothetical protein